jgi:hypothetical protein
MIALVYVSSAVTLMSRHALVELLTVSRRNNQRDGVSGLLLYRGGNFMQLLEGDEAQVRATHARIERDPRHRGVMTILQQPVSERLFDDWSMAFGNLDDPEMAALDGISGFLDRDFTDPAYLDDANRGLSLLRSFRQAMR